MKGFWNELQRRQIIKSAVAYLVVSWLIIQVLSILFPTFSFSPNALKTVIIFLAVLFPAWIIFNWIYEPSSHGLVKTDDTPDNSEGIEKKRISLNRVIIVGLSLAVIILVINTFRLQSKIIRDDDGKSSIAVLYFDNMSASEDNEWISDGMTESILTKLMPNEELLVISRTSVKQFKDSNESTPEIAKKLGVSYVLEGSVRMHNKQALISAQLIDKNDSHLWAKEYKVYLDDILEVQNEISNHIVNELKLVITPEQRENLKRHITNDVEAYKLYQKARTYMDDMSPGYKKNSLELLLKAIEIDSTFAEAYALLGRIYYEIKGTEMVTVEEAYEKITKFSNKAIEIDPKVSIAYSNLALSMTLKGSFNNKKYLDYLLKAIDINPNDIYAYSILADYYFSDGKFDKAISIAKKMTKIDPLSARTNWLYIAYLSKSDNFEEANSEFESNKHLFSEYRKHDIKMRLIEAKSIQLSQEKKDWSEIIKVYQDSIDKYPDEPLLHEQLAFAFNGILNDDVNSLKHAKRNYELFPAFYNLTSYIFALLENQMFDKVNEIMESKEYKDVMVESHHRDILFNYYYYQKNFDKCLEIMSKDDIHSKLLIYASLDDRSAITNVFEKENCNSTDKAFVYAILRERDSMYYYLSQEDIDYKTVNSRFEFDPYRKEERYKAFLKKHYLPLTHWNE